MRHRRRFLVPQGTPWARRSLRPVGAGGGSSPPGGDEAREGRPRGAAVTVAVLGDPDRVGRLGAFLPDDWVVAWCDRRSSCPPGWGTGRTSSS